MKTITDFPYEIKEDENIWIPMRDGIHLAARVWRPVNSDDRPVPAIVEYIPYRKRFGSTKRDEITHKYLAGHGYACVRLDIRGSGESEGILTDEYTQTELDDGIDALYWLAKQEWCTGHIGMMGISWGGFNALQIAAMQPEPLKAIVTVSSSDDRYADDIHHMGGTLLGDNLSWAGVMFSYNTMPPDPALVGEKWREMWKQRLEGSGLWLKTWLEHQRRDAYWRHGSVCENYNAIKIPVFAVSGWTDGYTNTVFRLMENLDVPRKGLVGPWGHTYPHIGRPGPAIDFLGELVRWWDRWLKGDENGVEHEPRIQAWMQDSAPPNPDFDYRSGHWVAEDEWPCPSHIEEHVYKLDTGRHLVKEDQEASVHGIDVQSPITLGLMAGKWCSYATGPDLSGDQRSEDGGSLVFQTEILEDSVEIMGAPVAELKIAANKPVAMVAVRLSNMRPDHQVTRVTYGLLNLTHRDGAEHPKPLEPGKAYKVRVPLNYIAQHFPKGHRIRVAISSVYWPLAWTPPEEVKLRIWTGESRIILPVRAPRKQDSEVRELGSPVAAPEPETTIIQPDEHRWTIHHYLEDKRAELEVTDDRGIFRLNDIDLTVGVHARECYSATTGKFTSARGETEWIRTLRRGDWNIKTRTYTCLSADKDYFYINAELDAYEGEARFNCQSWQEKIKRDHL